MSEPEAKTVAAAGLVGDIGGTHARFGWVTASGAIEQVRSLNVAQYPGPAQAARAYLAELHGTRSVAAESVVRRAALAVATAVGGDRVQFTNSDWRFSRAALQAELGLQTLLVLNDFEALALSLPRLGAAQLRPHASRPTACGTMAVIGPGTGLGVAGVVQTPQGWLALPGEGGHATLAAGDDFEAELLRRVRQEFGHVSAERLLSGIGLPVLHRAVAEVLGASVEPLTAQAVVERGLNPADPVCQRTLDVFCALLGSFAGNVALTLGARGGVFIGGGIVPRLGERFFASDFRKRFEDKGRFRAYLEAIPTALIIDTHAALTGAALALAQSGG